MSIHTALNGSLAMEQISFYFIFNLGNLYNGSPRLYQREYIISGYIIIFIWGQLIKTFAYYLVAYAQASQSLSIPSPAS